MKSYSVKQVADLLKTNPETVRRWIRSDKLAAQQDSRKGGNIIYESALQEFVISSATGGDLTPFQNLIYSENQHFVCLL